MLRSYESVFVASPTVAQEVHDRLVESFEEIITTNGGELTNTICMGRRPLAYEVKKFRDGIYTVFEFHGHGDLIKELERRYRLNDSVLKFLTIKTERKAKLMMKGAAKRKAKSDARAKRKASKAPEKSEER